MTSAVPNAKAQAVTDSRGYQLAADYSARNRGLSLLILRGGKIVFEVYQNGHTADTPHMLASGTKSFSGIMAVAAADD